ENTTQGIFTIMLFTAIGIPIHGQKKARTDLLEAIQYSLHPCIRRTDRPDSTNTRTSQECDHRMRGVWQVSRDAITCLDAPSPEGSSQCCHLFLQLGPAESFLLTDLILKYNGRAICCGMPEYLIDVVQPGIWKPFAIQH